MDKEKFIEQYKKLKDLNNGKKPLYRDFLKFCGIHKRKLDEVFGKNVIPNFRKSVATILMSSSWKEPRLVKFLTNKVNLLGKITRFRLLLIGYRQNSSPP